MHGVCYLTYVSAVYVTLLHNVATLPMLLHNVVTSTMLLHSESHVYTYVGRYTANAHSILLSVATDFFLHKYFSLIAAEYKTNTNNGKYKDTVKPTAVFTVYPDIELVTTHK